MNLPTEIYVVQGAQGSYDDYDNWVVCAFKDEEKANQLIQRVEERDTLLKGLTPKYGLDYHLYDFVHRDEEDLKRTAEVWKIPSILF